jgi:squalene synthase HpnC
MEFGMSESRSSVPCAPAGGRYLAPSGKSAATENFPVGSWLIARALRPHVAAYYAWARAIDDIADHPRLSPEEKLRRLDALELALAGALGRNDPELAVAWRLRESLLATGVPFSTATDLLSAFRQDAVTSRYETWEDLMDYCDRSAAPVGRFLLHLHGDAHPEALAASDALCNALQVINHLQDCREDYLQLDRIYLPQAWMREAGATAEMLSASSCAPPLRAVIDRCLDGTSRLMERARRLPARLKSRRLAMEAAVIVQIADALISRLAREDPLARRVRLSRTGYLRCGLAGVLAGLRAGRGA